MLGSIPAHVRAAGRDGSERDTVPVKPLMGLTIMMDVAVVAPSARTMLGREVPISKSGIEIESNVVGDVPRGSVASGVSLG